MAIEFHCPHCDKLLKTNDDKAGVQAKCPGCAEIVTVPGLLAERGAAVRAEPAVSRPETPAGSIAGVEAGLTPCPMCGEPIRATAVKCRYCGELLHEPGAADRFQPTRVEVGPIFEHAWQIFTKNLGTCVAMTLVTVLLSGLSVLPFGALVGLAENGGIDRDLAPVILIPFILLFYALMFFVTLGVVRMSLKMARGETIALRDLFSGGSVYLPALGAAILFSLMYVPGILLCVVPGVFVYLIFWPFLYLIVDRKAGAIESLSLARSLTSGNLLTGFVLVLINIGLQIAGSLACYVGLLFALPLIVLINAVAYLMMSGQRIAKL